MSSFFQVAEIELIYKSKVRASDRPQITSSKIAYDILLHQWSDQLEWVEEFNLLLINRANRVLGFYNVSKGGQSSTIVDAKVVFSAALKSRAVGIILSHNHPSGSLRPSLQDIELTKKLVAGAKLLDLTILDHIIVTPYNYYSFADEGKL